MCLLVIAQTILPKLVSLHIDSQVSRSELQGETADTQVEIWHRAERYLYEYEKHGSCP